SPSRSTPAPACLSSAVRGHRLGRRSVAGRGGRGLLRRAGGLALGALLAHLDHRGAVLVQAEVPRAAAREHLEPRCYAADRAGLLEPDQVAALRDPVGLVALRVAFAADEALSGFLRANDPEPVRLALLVHAAGLAALRTRAEDPVLVHALPDDLGELALVLVHQVVGLV